eukprot:3487881-Rhodomonas_salina.4
MEEERAEAALLSGNEVKIQAVLVAVMPRCKTKERLTQRRGESWDSMEPCRASGLHHSGSGIHPGRSLQVAVFVRGYSHPHMQQDDRRSSVRHWLPAIELTSLSKGCGHAAPIRIAFSGCDASDC